MTLTCAHRRYTKGVKPHTLRTLLAAALALMAALVILYAMLSLRSYFADHGLHAGVSGESLTDSQKLTVLQSLKGTTTPSTTTSKQILNSLSASSSTTVSEQTKLDILKSLHSK